VKIADTTLKKRLDEFKKTPSGSLTLADFRSVWLDEEMDPPAFTKGKEKEEAKTESASGKENVKSKGKKRSGKIKGKRNRTEDEQDGQLQKKTEVDLPLPTRPMIDPALLDEGILAGAVGPSPLFLPDYDPNLNIDPTLLPSPQLPGPGRASSPDVGSLFYSPTTEADEATTMVLAQEVSTFLQNPQGSVLSEALDEAEQRRLAQIMVVDELMGLDEEELDQFLLTEEEVKIKERVWVELNREYLESLAGMFILISNLQLCFAQRMRLAKSNREDSNTATKSRKVRIPHVAFFCTLYLSLFI
jgi:transcription factor IIIB 90 kDa subunit